MQASKTLGVVSALAMLALVVGCATKPAPDFGGRWKPVNHFSESSMEIPLYSSYVFQALPSDGTLKHMLERWASDNQMRLDYSATSDYTLYGPVAKISTTDLTQAVEVLNQAYAERGVAIRGDGRELVVTGRRSN
ncbi:hypothetical protein [Pseudoxanthomonas composti]|uniref:Toxin co-regulated pilus biosynthesis protein Q C-terminal domain-containing protein n=1 Tax=Pseudoxanthomonas composti TaxID=2137479 RepID=A0A4Q1K0H2_9GAMM|nr:hypothetical protein [Pseudoxanthomonas composti]RXR08521.1 hypothetical protein EPA99_01480 [Pseudoxanthomonas composti]